MGILKQTNCRTGTLHRFNPQAGHLKMIVQIGLSDQLLSKVSRIPIGKGIAGVAAERREPIQLSHLQTDPSGVAGPDAQMTGAAGSLAIPVIADDELIGTLGVGMFSPHDFSEDETRQLEKIAATIAPALKRSY